MNDGWTVVPDYFLSKWHNRAVTIYSDEEDWPRIGIYCPHDPHPFLIGSLTVSPMVLEERGTIYWSPENTWTDSNGIRFTLRARLSAQQQNLLDDTPRSKSELGNRLRAALHEQDQEKIALASAELDRFDSDTRGRIELACKTCGDSLRYRSQTFQAALSKAYAGGIRELTLEQLRRVSSLA